MKLWEVATGKPLRTLEGHVDFVWSLAYSPDGKMLVSGSHDKTVKQWEVATGTLLRTLEGHAGRVLSVAYSVDGKTLASTDSGGTILVHRVNDGTQLAGMRAIAGINAAYVLTPDRHVNLLGTDACVARQYPVCRTGNLFFPFDVCEEHFLAPGLLAKVHPGDTSYLEPENAPTLMNCPAEP